MEGELLGCALSLAGAGSEEDQGSGILQVSRTVLYCVLLVTL